MSKAVQVKGLCYEGIGNAVAGASCGPAFIRWGLESAEMYSLLQGKKLPQIDDFGDAYFHGLKPQEALTAMVNALEPIDPKKPFLILGGDHTISLPVIQYLENKKQRPDWIIHFDAHLDRRDVYSGQKIAHATVLKRIEEIVGAQKVWSFGIRSRALSEPWTDQFFSFEVLPGLKEFLNGPGKHGSIYLTLDLDVLDPGIMPAVSNPEPDGIGFRHLIEALTLLQGRLIGADLLELVPTKMNASNSAQAAAIVYRELLTVLAQ